MNTTIYLPTYKQIFENILIQNYYDLQHLYHIHASLTSHTLIYISEYFYFTHIHIYVNKYIHTNVNIFKQHYFNQYLRPMHIYIFDHIHI
jgi:hypothetical protein